MSKPIVVHHTATCRVRVAQVIFDDTPVFDGTEVVFGITMPERVYGIAHWPNVSPIGDIPLMFTFWAVDLYMAKKAFGSFLLPWETIDA